MKIVFVNRFFFPDQSATSQMLTDLAFHLAAKGHDVHVVASRQRFDEPGAVLLGSETVRGVRIHRVWTTRFGRSRLLGRAIDYASFYASAAAAILAVASRGAVVIAKTDPPLISVIAWPCARLRGARLINWVQDVFPEIAQALGVKGSGGAPGRLLSGLRNASLRGAAVNIALGDRMADYLAGQGVPREKLAILPNWADGRAIAPISPAKNRLRRDWGLDGKFVVGYSGNMGRAHEFETILGAAERLKDDPGIVFLFIGSGHGKATLERAAADRGLASLTFKPFQPREALGQSLTVPDVHLISLLPEMEGFVQPSKFYGAAAAGRPVAFIGAADGELARVVTRLDCGAVIPPGGSDVLASFLRELRGDAAELDAMGRRIRAAFEREYDAPLVAEKWDALLSSIGAACP